MTTRTRSVAAASSVAERVLELGGHARILATLLAYRDLGAPALRDTVGFDAADDAADQALYLGALLLHDLTGWAHAFNVGRTLAGGVKPDDPLAYDKVGAAMLAEDPSAPAYLKFKNGQRQAALAEIVGMNNLHSCYALVFQAHTEIRGLQSGDAPTLLLRSGKGGKGRAQTVANSKIYAFRWIYFQHGGGGKVAALVPEVAAAFSDGVDSVTPEMVQQWLKRDLPDLLGKPGFTTTKRLAHFAGWLNKKRGGDMTPRPGDSEATQLGLVEGSDFITGRSLAAVGAAYQRASKALRKPPKG